MTGRVFILSLTALDRAHAEYDFVPPPGAADLPDPGIGLAIATDEFVGLGRPGQLRVQIDDAATPPDKQPPVAEPSELDDLPAREDGKAWVLLFKPGGKFYVAEQWTIPLGLTDADLAAGAIRGDLVGPYAMRWSPDFHRVAGGPVLVPSQEPWGFPLLISGVES